MEIYERWGVDYSHYVYASVSVEFGFAFGFVLCNIKCRTQFEVVAFASDFLEPQVLHVVAILLLQMIQLL